jgi:ribonuclease VapC
MRLIHQVLEAADSLLISPMNYVEAGVVLTTAFRAARPILGLDIFLRKRRLSPRAKRFDEWLANYRVRSRASRLSTPALDAYLTFGKGRHPARLNLADCFAYALAKQLDAPLLYKGDDFPLTDVRSALDA